jgi:hypothetical protein
MRGPDTAGPTDPPSHKGQDGAANGPEFFAATRNIRRTDVVHDGPTARRVSRFWSDAGAAFVVDIGKTPRSFGSLAPPNRVAVPPDMCVGVLILVAEPPVRHWLQVKRLALVYSPLVALIPQPSLCPSRGSSSIRHKSIDLSGPSVLRAFA